MDQRSKDELEKAAEEAAKKLAPPAIGALGRWLRKRPFVKRVIRFFGGTP